ncbi:Regulator of chromosome condensation (RCC1) repeat protein [compost metagenome]
MKNLFLILSACAISVSCGKGLDGSKTSASKPLILNPVKKVTIGNIYGCALSTDGKVKCWGDGSSIGAGDTVTRGDSSGEMGDALPVVDFGTGRTVKDLDAGYFHSCAVLDNDKVKCWGNNYNGGLGLGDTNSRGVGPGEMGDNLPVVDLGPGYRATQVVAGAVHSCALLDDGSVKCWGNNEYGQLGLGDINNRGDGPGEMGNALLAVNLGTSRTATQIGAGAWHSCALLDNGRVKCWGENGSGQLGLGDNTFRGDGPGEMGDALPFVDLGTNRTAKKIIVGENHTCAILDNDSLKCWGYNTQGQLGLGDAISRGLNPSEMGDGLLPVDVGAGRKVKDASLSSYHSCAILDDSTVKCWGDNGYGEIGTGDSSMRGIVPGDMGDVLLPVMLGAGRTVISISAGGNNSCAVLDNKKLKCWGRNSLGQLGLGDTVPRGQSASDMGDNLPYLDIGSF